MTSRRIGSALFLIAFAAFGAAEVELSAALDSDQVALDGTVTMSITATYSSKGEPGELQPPALNDFDLVSRQQSEQVSFAFVNGAPSFHRTIVTTLALTPKRAGDLVIEPASLEYHGRTYATQPLKVHVLSAGQTPPPSRAQRRPSPFDALDQPRDDLDPFADVHPGSRDLLLRASVDNDRPFVGQQISYSLYLLARINVSGIDKLQLPRLDGFWTEEIEAPQQLVGEARILDGVPYRSFLLRKRALFALRPGHAVIEPAEVEVLTGFGMLFSRGSSRRQSQEVTLDVQPLPPGKPLAFDPGNVGQWSLSATVDPITVAVGQPVTFKLVATGRGNVRDLRLPRLGAIAGLRAYDATTTDKETIEKGQVTGTRTVEQLLVPERTGVVDVPALAMDIFDPVQKQYRTLHTEAVSLHVAPAVAGAAAAESVAQNLLAAGGVRPIRLRLTGATRGAPPWSTPWFWPLLAAPPFGLALLLGLGRMRRLLMVDPQQRRVKLARTAAARRLRGAQALLAKGEAPAFYAEVARAITGYLADKQGVVAAGLTREELARALAERGHSEEVVGRLLRVLDDCDRARFAPRSGEATAREAMLTRADQILNELERK
ncbi:MAG: BatD family protein [Myxococcales bacterium]|nr:BatD family protein [Myxococcales bacterium]